MATLKWIKGVGIGTGVTTLSASGSVSSPAVGFVWNIPRLYLTNITAGIVKVTVTHTTAGVACRLAFTRPIAIGDDLILENIVMLNGDTITVVADVVTAVDAFGSVDEEAA